MNNKPLLSFPTEGGSYTIDPAKLEMPLHLIKCAFSDELEVEDTFHQLTIVVDGYVMHNNENNPIALSHNMEKMIVITQLLAACAMIGNSFEFIPDKK